MKALRYIGGEVIVANGATPEREGEALVRVLRSGICNTDLEIVRGYAGFEGTIGHEFVGVIERCHDTSCIGQRVVGEINVGCGVCPECQTGDERHCPRRTVLGIVGRDGAHAEFLSLPMRNLRAVPDAVSDEDAVFVEPLAAALAIAEQVPIEHTQRIAVVGDGKLGLLCTMAMTALGGRVTTVGKHRTKLDIAASAGAEALLAAELGTDLERTFDVVVEASGSPTGFETAVRLVRPRGRIVLKSTFHGRPEWPATSIVVDEIAVIGSRCGRAAPAIEMLSSGRISLSGLISDEMPLSGGVEALDRAAVPGVLKILLDPSK